MPAARRPDSGGYFRYAWGANGRPLGRGLPPYPDMGFWDTGFRIWGYPQVTIDDWF